MQAYAFFTGKPVQAFDFACDEKVKADFLWLVTDRAGLPALLKRLETSLHLTLHEEHREDCFNETHPSFFDVMQDYYFLIYRSLDLSADSGISLKTQSVVFILRDRMLITVHEDDSAVSLLETRIATGLRKPPATAEILLYHLLIGITDKFLSLRDELGERFSEWQDRLLDDRHRFQDWHAFLAYKSSLQRFHILCEGQMDVVNHWQQALEEEEEETPIAHIHVHLADLSNHIKRGLKFSQQLQYQIDSLIQLNYSLMTSMTNQVMQVLTVISAIFLPLTLLTGIFGMNFEHLPFLSWRSGFYLLMAFMLVIVVGLLCVFRRRRWV